MKITYEYKPLFANFLLLFVVISVGGICAYLILSLRGYILCHGLPSEYSPSFSPLHTCVISKDGITTKHRIQHNRYTTRFVGDIK